MFFRIGIGPDGKHLFMSAGGAGYVIEARSRTLVETISTRVRVERVGSAGGP